MTPKWGSAWTQVRQNADIPLAAVVAQSINSGKLSDVFNEHILASSTHWLQEAVSSVQPRGTHRADWEKA